MNNDDSPDNVDSTNDNEKKEPREDSHISETTRPYSTQLNDYDDFDDDDTDCCITGCTRFSTPVTFLLVVVPIYTLIVASSTYLGGCISTIEKQFQLSSSKSGFITTINDMVSLFLALFATYYGSKCHRPKLLSISCIVIGVGYFVLSVPHFTSDPIGHDGYLVMYNDSYGGNYIGIDNALCYPGDVVHDRCVTGDSKEDQPLGVFWLVIGQIIIGIGSAPVFPLIITYLDDSTINSTTSSIYLATLFMAMAIGPFVGFVSSFKCLSFYVDFYRVDEQSIPSNPHDPRWVGAWWLGFAIVGVMIVVLSIPLSFFPRNLKKYEFTCFKRKSKDEKSHEQFSIADVYKTSLIQENGIKASLKGLTTAMKRLVTNPTLVLVKLSASCDLAIISGFAFFSAKYVENQFAVSPATASMILGTINLPGSLCANMLSSFIVKHFKLTQYGLSKMMATFATISFALAIPLLLLGCSNPDIAGVTTVYNKSYLYNQPSLPDFNSNCNSNCACPDRTFKPVCGSDGMTYASACHAGCIGVWQNDLKDDLDKTLKNDTIFFGCSCISTSDIWKTTDGSVEGGIATEGSCDWACGNNKLIPFAVLVTFIAIFASMKPNPSLMLSLRCVDPDDRALGIAFGSVIVRVLGLFPAPIYFGASIASTCLVRQESCSREGACIVYDLERYRLSFIGLFVGLKSLAIILALCLYGSIDLNRLEKNKSKAMVLEEKKIVGQQSGKNDIKHV